MRENRVFLKSLEGSGPVDVILRRMDDGYCDPLELALRLLPGSARPGRSGAQRETLPWPMLWAAACSRPRHLFPFLPGLSRKLLGERLALPSVATWWCGQPAANRYVRQNLDFLVIKPAFPAKGMEPVFGGRLAPNDRSRLLAQLQKRPNEFVGQELLNLSSVPGLVGERLACPPRGFACLYRGCAGDSWIVMPGGLTRVSPSADTPVVSMQHGGGSKDTWVLSP